MKKLGMICLGLIVILGCNSVKTTVESAPTTPYLLKAATQWAESALLVWKIETALGHASAVPIECKEIEGKGEYRTLMLTAYHVAEEIHKESLAFAKLGARAIRVKSVVSRPPTLEQDVALIELESSTPVLCVPIRTTQLLIGEDVYTSGFGGAKGLWITYGIYCGEGRASSSICPGDSGGALLDSQGRLVGILSLVELISAPWQRPPVPVFYHCEFTEVFGLSTWLESN